MGRREADRNESLRRFMRPCNRLPPPVGAPAAVFLDAGATSQQLEQMRHQLGLDEPFYLQMITRYGRILHGDDLGRSILLDRRVAAAIIEPRQ